VFLCAYVNGNEYALGSLQEIIPYLVLYRKIGLSVILQVFLKLCQHKMAPI